MIPESNPTISILNALNRHIMAVYELTLNQFSGYQISGIRSQAVIYHYPIYRIMI